MPTSKSKTKQRKEQKLRPYRVDYFLHDEMLKDKALVRSKVIRAVTADYATAHLASILPISDGELTVIRAYRFYKTLSAEPKKKTYIEVAKLLSAKEAIEVMTTIENRKVPIVIRPEDLPQDHPDHVCTDKCYDIVEIDPSKAIEKVREILDPWDWRPSPECLSIRDIVNILRVGATDRNMYHLSRCERDRRWVDNYAQMADPNPDRNYKFGDPQPTKVFIPEWGPDTDTSNVAAGQPSPYLFPDKPLVPTTDAVFDGEYSADSIKVLEGMGSARPESRAFAPCRWHGEKYIDQADGDRCTALDPGSKYLSDLYAQQFVPRRPFAEEVAFSNAIARFNDPPMSLEVVADHHTDETVRNVDLDEAAPILHPAPEAWEPTVNIPSMDEMRQAMREPQPEWDECVGQGQDDETKDSSRGGIITVATILTILGLIAAYFKWFAK